MSRRMFVVTILCLIAALFTFSAVFASTYNGIVVFSCVHVNARDTGSIILDRDNTGAGQEALRVDITDGAGTLILTETFSNVLDTYSAGIGVFVYTTAPQYNPLTFTLTSLAGNGLPEQVDFVAQGNCAGLPMFAPPGGCIPYDGVMGDIPHSTQAYFAPGKQANGVTVNPGTYMVVGVDESSGFYKIIVACDYVWVPVSAVQPSFQSPWSGQPLPSGVVS